MKPVANKNAVWVLLFALIVAYACAFLDTHGQNYPSLGANKTSGDYLINPDTILEMIDQGTVDVFLPMLATPGPNDELLPSGSYAWTQFDFLKIATALNQFIWNDDMEDWNVYYVTFGKDCHNETGGFDAFDIIYFKSLTEDSERLYTTRQISIYPLARQVTWGSDSNYLQPFLGDWFTQDLSNFNVTADEALEIAEDNGGKDARLRVKDACNILVDSPHNNDQAWSVSYYVRASFQVIIDPYNGEFQVFNEFR
jgi:hypothetical protein